MTTGIVRIDFERLAIVDECFVHSPLTPKRVTQRRVGDRRVRSAGECRAVVSSCFCGRSLKQFMAKSAVGPKVGRMTLLNQSQESRSFTTAGPPSIAES